MILAIIGLGEAGSAFVEGWRRAGAVLDIRAYDIKIHNESSAHEIHSRVASLRVEGCSSSAEAVADADLVFSTVTADQALVAAEEAAACLKPGAFWCDMNSCAPSTKKVAERTIHDSDGKYVDVAVMSPVKAELHLTPLLLSGCHANEVAPILSNLPMTVDIVEGKVGAASAIKMIRSIMIKGMEALTAECVLAAVESGVEQVVLDSLRKSNPGIDWPEFSLYNFERMLWHGKRRAAEMEEVSKCLNDLGLPSDMARATTCWQRRISVLGDIAEDFPDTQDLEGLAKHLLSGVRSSAQQG